MVNAIAAGGDDSRGSGPQAPARLSMTKRSRRALPPIPPFLIIPNPFPYPVQLLIGVANPLLDDPRSTCF